MRWHKGRGRLGLFDPLFGIWRTEANSERGQFKCEREFKKTLSGTYIQLTAHWEFADKSYDELAMIGVNSEKEICFWSFTSDGRQSNGKLADVTDVHPEAIGFQAKMPAGTARMVYWPDEDKGFYWMVESKTKKGWNRFVEHHYLPVNKAKRA
ncbi:MAG: hypothetical protein K8S20_04980 [Chloroflexi bacterium]|nr:hypothetical protein [Chloroflexota bacterium]